MEPGLDFRNTNSLWCSVLVESLVRCGLRHAVISPGSRSTPLTMACVRHSALDAIPVIDERSAAFFALGLAKRTHRPVALICTSGTAGANYFPAIIEAHESRTPLLVLTADRPPELRDCASGQTIDQQKLFGGYVQFYHELAVPEAKIELLAYVRQTMAHAMARCTTPTAGPVHINLPFRDPLAPLEEGNTTAALASVIDDAFFNHLQPHEKPAVTARARQRPTTTRGLIIAGPANPENVTHYVTSIRNLATSLGWPVLADALSPVRHHATELVQAAGGTGGVRAVDTANGVNEATVIAHYDAILRDERRARELTPRTVLCLEGWPTSKVLRAWLERSGAEVVLISASPQNRDALHGRTRQLPLPVESFAAERRASVDTDFVTAWREAEARAKAHLTRAFDATAELFEGKATWLLAQHLPAQTPVFVASSMPVRDVEYFWPANDRGAQVFFNRGANGIDGTLSTALGIAQAGDTPVVLLAGDLALLHDANGLLLREHFRGSLTVVLINNRGGGIFEHLPVAQFDPPFEKFFATPQSVEFASLCTAHGVAYELVRDWSHFVALISQLPKSGIRVLELRTDRKRDATARKRLLDQAGR